MNPKHRSSRVYLEDIESSMLKIFEYIGENNFIQFKQNSMLVDAVVRNFEIIGEATRNIPDEIMSKYPEIPWKKMYGLRNLISHEYFGIDYEMIWKIVGDNLPQNLKDIQRILKDERITGVL
ncbi:MAG: DUF86 domain-containing protein [Bacteroidales bacterium]|nr:DUF86 domain-containing protein [Bacteroidales bacterium]